MARKRWMLFVDGENLHARGKKILAETDTNPQQGQYYTEGAFLWFRSLHVRNLPDWAVGLLDRELLEPAPIRAFYYSSFSGDINNADSHRTSLQATGFHAELFHKQRNKKTKRVDITLARDMLVHAFRDNFDVAIILSGDEDYVPLVEEVKRAGKIVWLCWFENTKVGGLSDSLRLSADAFFPIDKRFVESWKRSA